MSIKSILSLPLALALISCGGGGGGGGSESSPSALFTISTSIITISLDEDTAYEGSIAYTVNASEAYTLSFAITSNPAIGSVQLSSNGSFIYTPNNNIYGSDSFEYSIVMTNSTGTKNVSSSGAASLTINSVNDEPIIAITQFTPAEDNTPYPLVFIKGNQVRFSVAVSDVDDGDVLTLSVPSPSNIPFTYDLETQEAVLDVTSLSLSGKKDIEISVSDGIASKSEILTFWLARDMSKVDSLEKVYQLTGNSLSTMRLNNFVIILDNLDPEVLVGARKSTKNLVTFFNQNIIAPGALDLALDGFMNIGVIETSGTGLGVTIGCDEDFKEIYCFGYTLELMDEKIQEYFADIDLRALITSVAGRGAALGKYFIMDLLDAEEETLAYYEIILKHEFGHIMADLNDEYSDDWDAGTIDCENVDCGDVDLESNTTSEDTPEDLKWAHWIADIENVAGFDDDQNVTGIGMFEGTYYGPKTYRASFNNIMRDPYSDVAIFQENRTPADSNSFDVVASEAFIINALKLQGLHSWRLDWDDGNIGDVTFSTDLTLNHDVFSVYWYLNGEEQIELRDLKSITLEKKISTWDTVAYRVFEKNSKHLRVVDNINTFNDVYEGTFSDNRSRYICPDIRFSENKKFDDVYSTCRVSFGVYLTNGTNSHFPGDFGEYRSFEDLQQEEFTNVPLIYDESGRGSAMSINWSHWAAFQAAQDAS